MEYQNATCVRMAPMVRLVALCCVLVASSTASLAGQPEENNKWGALRVRFIYDGMDFPRRKPLPVFKDVEVMKKFDIVDERWTVDPRSLGIANVIVYMENKDAPIHPSYEKNAKAVVPLTFSRGRLNPHVVCVRSSQTLEIRNVHPVGYCAKCELLFNQPFNVVVPRGVAIQRTFTVEERIPTRLTDNIHPWVGGWLLVRESPYMGFTGRDGFLLIDNVPAGTWTFRFWHEEAGFLLARGGRFEIEIKPGEQREMTFRLREGNKGSLTRSTTRPIDNGKAPQQMKPQSP